MENLTITATLATPVAGDFTLPLDGILLAAALGESGAELLPQQPGQPCTYEPDLVPLARIGSNDSEWFYACSFAHWDGGSADGIAYWNKRYDDLAHEAYTPLRRKPVTRNGRYKNYHMPLRIRHGLRVTWHAVGDGERIGALLWSVVGIGKKRNYGFGEVLRWQVFPSDADLSIRDADGAPARAVPVSWWMAQGWPPGGMSMATIRPPYWSIDHYAMCVVP